MKRLVLLYIFLLSAASGHSRRLPFDGVPVPALPTDTVTVTVIGDVMMHSAQIENCHERYAEMHGTADPDSSGHYDYSPCFREIRDMLVDADICIANMEFTLAGAPYSGYPAFCAPESFADHVADCGVDVFLTANNHIFDKGEPGARRTLGIYRRMQERGIRDTGCYTDSLHMSHAYPLIVEKDGIRIALVNFTYGTNVGHGKEFPKVSVMDREEIAAAMQTARDSADIIIALPHWGTEYALKHSAEQAKMAEFLVRRGADAVIGSHPHVVQDIDSLKALSGDYVPVVYSLGNIISNMSAPNTRIGLMATVPVIRYTDGSTSIGKISYTFTWCTLPGRLEDSHMTIPVERFKGRRELWSIPSDYDNMVDTYNRILEASGIKGNEKDNNS